MRKKPWIRYERGYSLSAGHMDWYQHRDGRWVCVVLDDASRKILSWGEYNNRSADAAVELVQEVLDKYGHIRRLREVITDHGSVVLREQEGQGWKRQASVRGVLQGERD